MVSSSPRYRPSATRIGSTSPIDRPRWCPVASFGVSGVAPIHATGVSSARSATRATPGADRTNGWSLTSHPSIAGARSSRSLTRWWRTAWSSPGPLAEGGKVGPPGSLGQAGENRIVEPHHAREQRRAGTEPNQEVLPELLLNGPCPYPEARRAPIVDGAATEATHPACGPSVGSPAGEGNLASNLCLVKIGKLTAPQPLIEERAGPHRQDARGDGAPPGAPRRIPRDGGPDMGRQDDVRLVELRVLEGSNLYAAPALLTLRVDGWLRATPEKGWGAGQGCRAPGVGRADGAAGRAGNGAPAPSFRDPAGRARHPEDGAAARHRVAVRARPGTSVGTS